jgi:hypothetical protein
MSDHERILQLAAVAVCWFCAAVLVLAEPETVRLRVTAAGLEVWPRVAWALFEEREAVAAGGPARTRVVDDGGGVSGARVETQVITPEAWGPVRCEELADYVPRAGDFEALVSGSMGLVEFLARNPGVGLRCAGGGGSCQWQWSNERRECLAGAPPRTFAFTPAVLGERLLHEVWGGEGGTAVKLEVAPGTMLRAHLRAENPGAVSVRFIERFDRCDIDLDGRRGAGDLRAFMAGPYDWDGDGRVDIGDFQKILQGCFR